MERLDDLAHRGARLRLERSRLLGGAGRGARRAAAPATPSAGAPSRSTPSDNLLWAEDGVIAVLGVEGLAVVQSGQRRAGGAQGAIAGSPSPGRGAGAAAVGRSALSAAAARVARCATACPSGAASGRRAASSALARARRGARAGAARGPLEIEIGFGKGRYLLARAAAAPDHDLPRHRVGGDLLERRPRAAPSGCGLANVITLCGDALYVLARLPRPRAAPTPCTSTFPDPWPKTRHHRRRLLDPSTVDLVVGVLAPGGALYFATDHADYGAAVLGGARPLSRGRGRAGRRTVARRRAHALRDQVRARRTAHPPAGGDPPRAGRGRRCFTPTVRPIAAGALAATPSALDRSGSRVERWRCRSARATFRASSSARAGASPIDRAEAWRWLTDRPLARALAGRPRRGRARAAGRVGGSSGDIAPGTVVETGRTERIEPERSWVLAVPPGGSAVGGVDPARDHAARRRRRLRRSTCCRAAFTCSRCRRASPSGRSTGVAGATRSSVSPVRPDDGPPARSASGRPRSGSARGRRRLGQRGPAGARNARTASARPRPGVDAEPLDARQMADEVADVLHRLEHAVAVAHQHRGLAEAVRILGRVRDQELAGIEARARLVDQRGEARRARRR